MTYVREAFKTYNANSQDIDRNDGLLTDIRYFINFKKNDYSSRKNYLEAETLTELRDLISTYLKAGKIIQYLIGG